MRLSTYALFRPCLLSFYDRRVVANLSVLRGEKLHKDQKLQEIKPTDGLYPLQALIRPVALRFKYHFEGSRQTNRLDKVSQSRCYLVLLW